MEKLPLNNPEEFPIEERDLGMDGHVKMIRFGEDFDNWPDSRKISYLKKLASAMNQAASDMQDERNNIAKELIVQKELCKNADQALSIQKTIVMNHLTSSNLQTNEYAKQIQELTSRIKTQDKVIDDLNKQLGR